MTKDEGRQQDTVLVVEDDDALRGLIIKMMHKSGRETAGFASGTEALEYIAAGLPVALLLDQNLPDMSGLKLLDALAERDIRIPFIVMTGQGDERLAVEMMKRGASDYLVKDMDFLDLLPVAVERVFKAIRTEQALREAEDSLRESEERFRFLVDHAHDLIWRLKSDGVYTYVSPASKTILGYEPSYMVGKTFRSFVHPDDVALCEQYMSSVIKAQEGLAGPRYRFRQADGCWRWHEGAMTPVFSEGGAIMDFVGVARDITERKRAEDALARSLAFEKMVSGISANFVNLPPERLDEGINYVLQVTGAFFGVDRSYLFRFSADGQYMSNTHEWCAEGIEPQSHSIQNQPVDSLPWWAASIRHQDRVYIPDVDELPPEAAREKLEFQDQAIRSLLCVPIKREGNLYGFFGFDSVREQRAWTEDQVLLLQVVAELIANALVRHMNEETIRRLSFNDQLTGLYNRRYFANETARLNNSREHPIAVISADLDGLKLINDTLGHTQGDRYLRVGAELLQNALRASDIVARVGGDEFALLLPRTKQEAAEQVVARIRKQVADYNKEKRGLPLSISLGLAVSQSPEYLLEDTFRRADNHMYNDKLQQGQKARARIVSHLLTSLFQREDLAEGDRGQVQALSISLGQNLGLPEKRLAGLAQLAQVYDLGKVDLPNSLLQRAMLGRASDLTEAERETLHRHPEVGYRIALSSPELAGVAELILKHHENFDGTGYPLGLKGEEIPLECRILAICIAYSAMTHGRACADNLAHTEALAEFKRCAGSRFDPDLVQAFAAMMASEV